MIFLLLATWLTSNAQLVLNTVEDEAALGNTVLYYEASGNGSDYGSKDLGKDLESGCSCREYIRRYVTCYDIENCRRFPRDLQFTLETFKIGTTAITEIVRGDLRHLHHLQTLLIEANNNLNRLETGIFLNMSVLANLSISYNPNLLSLEPNLFEGLTNLGELLLAKNGFDEVKDFSLALSTSVLPRLWKLSVKEMHCPEIGKSDFVNLTGSRLSEVNFINLQIEYIHPEAFAPLKRLGTLRLGGNIMNESILINLMTSVDVPLRNLSLFGLGFRKEVPKSLLEAIALTNVTWLCLCKNQFDVISDESFPYMPHLEVLDLSDVQVSNITPHAFALLPNLKMLLLNKNKFSGVPEGVVLNYLTILDLSENSGVFSSPSYFTLEKNKFKNMTSLERLHLSHNNLRKIPRESFNGLPRLKVLEMKDSNIFLIENEAFSNLGELTHLDLEKNQFPTRNFNKEIFLGLDKLEVLLMGRCQIKNISRSSDIFGHLRSLKLLDLRGNELKILPADILAPLKNLRGINLGENQVIVWQDRMFRANKHLEVLLAFDNKLAYLSRAMLEDFAGLKAIDISKNPFNCECHSLSAFHGQYQRKEIEEILRLIDERPSYCVYPDEYVNFTIVDYFKTMTSGEICEVGFLQHYIWYIIPAILVMMTTAFVILIYVYRWHIRYWMFLTKLALHRNKQFVKRSSADLKCYTNYEYDAFVSYSNEDRNFVVRLVAMLENHEPYLKLCVYERDFQIGTVISETVLESVSKSRKTLLIISDSYIKSQWCRWEVQVAEHHRLFFENEYGECVNDSIVMIKLGNIAYANLSPMLKYLMKTRIYLQWDPAESKQKVFWEKLRNALAPPKMELSDCNKNV